MIKLDGLDPGYLKRYADRYRVYKAEDGIWNIRTRIRPSKGLEYDIFVLDGTRLAALLPPRLGLKVLRAHPDHFVIHQEADDGIVVIFLEKDLDRLADILRLKRRRHMSARQRQLAVERLSPFQFRPQVTGAKSSEFARSQGKVGQNPQKPGERDSA